MADLEVTFQGVSIPANTSGTVYVYEDVGDNGGANSVTIGGTTINYDNVGSATLSEGTTTYTLSGFDASSGNRIWPRVELDNSDDVSTAMLTEAIDVTVAVPPTTDPTGITRTGTTNEERYEAPAGASELRFQISGVKGIAGYPNRDGLGGYDGGNGGDVDATISISGGETYRILGADGQNSDWYMGGVGGNSQSSLDGDGGEGAGAAAILLDSDGSIVGYAGGGGGGGAYGYSDSNSFADGGGGGGGGRGGAGGAGGDGSNAGDPGNGTGDGGDGGSGRDYTDTGQYTGGSAGSDGGAGAPVSTVSQTVTPGGSAQTQSIIAIAPTLTAPPNVAVSSTSSGTTITWDDVDYEDHYRVERSPDGGSTWNTLGTTTTTSYDDTSAADGTAYDWRVVAVNDADEATSSAVQTTTYAPPPTFDTLSVVDDNGDGTADEFDCAWTRNSTDEDHHEVLVSTDGGSTFAQAGSNVAAGTTTYITPEQPDGIDHVVKIRSAFSDTTADSGTKAATTELPDVTKGSITPTDASTEDQLTLPNANVADTGDVRYQIRVTGSGNAYGSDVVVAQGGSDATFTGLLDGEQYDIRARSETADVTGTYFQISDTTLLPTPTIAIPAGNIGANSVTIDITDNADNEDGIRVERRRQYSDGWGPWRELADLAPDTTSYTDSGVVPGTIYEYRAQNYTEHVTATGNVEQITTDASGAATDSAPPSGWYAEVTASDGSVRRFRATGDPERDPSLDDLEEVRLPRAKDTSWDAPKWEDADVKVWQDSKRLPVDTLRQRGQTPGQSDLVAVGPDELYKPGQYEFLNTDVHAAFADVLDDTSLNYTIESPDSSNRKFDTVDTESEFVGYFEDPGAQDPVVIDSTGLHLSQTCHFTEGEAIDASTVTDSAYSGGEAGALASNGREDYTFTLDHEIPAGKVGIYIREEFDAYNGQVYVELDGFRVSERDLTGSGTTGSLSWRFQNGRGTGTEDTTALSAGDHTLRVGSEFHSGGQYIFDCITVFDERYHDGSTFDDSVDANGYLSSPALYPTGGQNAILLHQGFLSATGARVEGTFDDTSGDQALALSNDYGSNYATCSNCANLETDFASPGADIQMRVTLDAYGSRATGTPTQNYLGQTLQEYTLFEDVRNSPPLQNSQFEGDRKDILTALVNRGDAMWAAEWDETNDEIIIHMGNVEDLSSPLDLDIVDYEWDTTTLGEQVEWANVKGGRQTVRAETITANHGVAVPLNNDNLIPGLEQVRDPSTGTVYQRGSDYEVDTYVTGDIRTSASGNITDGQSLEVDYDWQPTGEYAVPPADERKRIREKLPSAVTDALCQSVAYYLVDRLQDPVVGGTATIDDIPPGLSLLEVFAADPLPSDVTDSFTVESASVRDGQVTAQLASRKSTGELISVISDSIQDVQDRV